MYIPVVYANCACNVYECVRQRVGIEVPSPDEETVQQIKRFAAKVARRARKVKSRTVEQVRASLSGPDLEKFDKGWADFLREGLFWRDTRHKMFVKSELGELRKREGQADVTNMSCTLVMQKPRAIFNISDKLSAVGKIVYPPVEHVVLKLKDSTGKLLPKQRSVMKGLNAVQRARAIRLKWERFTEPCAISLDGSQCDAHMRRHLLEMQRDFDLTVNRSSLMKALWNVMLKNFTLWGRGLKAEQEPMRLSGTWDTGGGNSLIHLLIVAFALQGERYEVAIDGDDVLLVCERQEHRRLLEKLHDTARKLSVVFTGEEPVFEFQKIEFTRCQPIRCGGQWKMVRKPRRALSNFFGSHTEFAGKYLNAYLKTVADGERRVFSGVPILSVLYEKVYKDNADEPDYKGPKISKFHWKGSIDSGPVDDIARDDFHRAFGICAEEQSRIEKQILSTRWKYKWADPIGPVTEDGRTSTCDTRTLMFFSGL
jgi:hypothetical protein